MPILTATAGNAQVQVTGTPDNCIIDTYYGIEPYLFNHPENQGFDPGRHAPRSRGPGSLPNVDLNALAAGPLVVPFNVDYVEGNPPAAALTTSSCERPRPSR